MDGGTLQLLFLGLLILASVFDAVGRRRKRRRRMEEMEREEAAGDGEGSGTSARWPADPGSVPEEAGTPSPRERHAPAGARAGGRETADSMVPDDLWAILTGEERSGEGRGGGPSTPGQIPEEDASGGPDFGTRETPERLPPMPESGRDPEPSWGDQPYAPGEAPPDWQPAPPPVVVRPDPPRMPPPAPAPLPSRRRTPPASVPRAFPLPRGDHVQGAGPMYVNLLREGGRGSLRQAIVLTEVFGTPVALRSPGREGGGFPQA